jgi:hypothetical protein
MREPVTTISGPDSFADSVLFEVREADAVSSFGEGSG